MPRVRVNLNGQPAFTHMSNVDAQTMAILVLWGAIAECEPIRSERQQLEPVVYTADQKYFVCLWEGPGVRTVLEYKSSCCD